MQWSGICHRRIELADTVPVTLLAKTTLLVTRMEINTCVLCNCPQEHYKDLSSKPFFPKLVEYIISGPVVAMVWKTLMEEMRDFMKLKQLAIRIQLLQQTLLHTWTNSGRWWVDVLKSVATLLVSCEYWMFSNNAAEHGTLVTLLRWCLAVAGMGRSGCRCLCPEDHWCH